MKTFDAESPVHDYIDSLNTNNKMASFYNQVLDFEMEHFIPAIRLDTALFLQQFVSFIEPDSILEIGFGSGMSALSIYHGLKMSHTFFSIERDPNRFHRGKRLLAHLNVRRIELVHCDAFDFLESQDISYDFIFLDAVKRDYIDYLGHLKEALHTGGYLVCDNTLFNGKIVLSGNELDDKYKNGVSLLKQFNKTLAEDPDFETVFYNIGDGLSVSRKISGE